MKDSEAVKVGHFKISNGCFLSYPCRHAIINTLDHCNDNETILNGIEIYTLLKKHGLSHIHFDGYAKFVQTDNDTQYERATDYEPERKRKRV